MMMEAFLHRKAADSSIMDKCGRTVPSFSKMQGAISLTLSGWSLSGHTYYVVESIFA